LGLGILIGGILLIGACGLLIAAGTNVDTPTGDDTALEDDGGSGGSEEKRSPQKTRRFSGNGSKNVGTIKVTDDAVLKWKHSESGEVAFFTISDDDFKINVSADSRSGETALEPGTYKNVDVSATGDWSMTIKRR